MAWSGSYSVPSVVAPGTPPVGNTYTPFQGIGAGQTQYYYGPNSGPRIYDPNNPTSTTPTYGQQTMVQPWNSPSSGVASMLQQMIAQRPTASGWGGQYSVPQVYSPMSGAAAASPMGAQQAPSSGVPNAADFVAQQRAAYAARPVTPTQTGPLPGLGGWTSNPIIGKNASPQAPREGYSGILGNVYENWGRGAQGGFGIGTFPMGGWVPGQNLSPTLAGRQMQVSGTPSGWGGGSQTTLGQYLAPWTQSGQAVYSASQIQQLQQQLAALQNQQQQPPTR